ncbi:MAG: nicotinate-nucleotide--dimethylbenzimidazole phosphoribosyltransferase [Thermodesulfobacteriota bacterium]
MFSRQDLNDLLAWIEPVDQEIMREAARRLDNKTKPPGSLGMLEELACRMCGVQRSLSPCAAGKVILIFVGDHGVTSNGVSCIPKEVTRQMVYNFLNGGAGVNVLARHVGAEVRVVDVGVDGDFEVGGLIRAKVKRGTENLALGPAMTVKETLAAVGVGVKTAGQAIIDGADIIGTGDMGIGNTTPSAALFSALLAASPESVTGRGAGLNENGLAQKITVVRKGLEVNSSLISQGPLEALAAVGGFEIAAICGVVLECARQKVPVVVDGFISSAGALIALKMKREVKDYCFFSHCSAEQGHRIFLEKMGIKPILDLDMRLGEGTGAALAMGIIEAGIKILIEMATFEEAGINLGSEIKV